MVINGRDEELDDEDWINDPYEWKWVSREKERDSWWQWCILYKWMNVFVYIWPNFFSLLINYKMMMIFLIPINYIIYNLYIIFII